MFWHVSWSAVRFPKEFSKIDAIMGEEIEETGDFVVDEKDKVVNLTEQGVQEGGGILPH